MQTMTLVAPRCTCCAAPAALTPRDDLPGTYAACPSSGQLYRPEGETWAPAALPPMAPSRPAPSVRIDLSRSGYA